MSIRIVAVLAGALLLANSTAGQRQSRGFDPRFIEHVRAGIEARKQSRLDVAARELEAAARLVPNVAEVYLNLGLVRHDQRNWLAATEAFQEALQLKPDLKGVRDILGFDFLMLGQVEQALEYLQQAYNTDPSNPDINFWLGLAYLEAAQNRKAIERLETARQSKPQDVDLLFYLARAYQRVSVELQDELLRTAPDSARAHLAAAEDHAYNGRTQLAIEAYAKVADLDPNMPGIYGAIAELHASGGNYDDAEWSYQKELGVSPQNPRTNYRYGLVLLKLGRSADAARHLELAVEGDSSIVDAFAQLGKALLQEGKLPEAEKALLRVLAMNPAAEAKKTAHYQLARLYRRQGNREEATKHMEAFNTLSDSAPDN